MMTLTKPCPSCGVETPEDQANDHGLCVECMGGEPPAPLPMKTFHVHQDHIYTHVYEVQATSHADALDKFCNGQHGGRVGEPRYQGTDMKAGVSLAYAVRHWGEAIRKQNNHYIVFQDRLWSISDIREAPKL